MDEGIRIPIDIEVASSFAAIDSVEKRARLMGEAFTDAIRPVDKLKREIEDMGRSASRSGAGLAGIENALRAPGQQMDRLTSSAEKAKGALGNLPNSSNQATLALSNLSRVAQDAPYGFIGIANNLNPLLESFQRLKASTGSTGSALKALGSSLTGAGGIGLAIGVVSSLLVVFGDKLFGVSKAAKEANEENKKLAESISGDIVTLTSLVAIITNVNAKSEDQRKALAAVNQEYSKRLPLLEQEKITLENISAAYDKIIDSLLRQAVVKGLQEEIEKSVNKTASSIIALEKAEARRGQTLTEINPNQKKNVDVINEAAKGLQRYTNTVRDGNNAQAEQRKELTSTLGAVNNFESRLSALKGDLKKDLSPLFDIMKNFSFDDLNVQLDKGGKNIGADLKKQAADIISTAKEISGATDNIITISPKFNFLDTKDDELKKGKAFLNDFFAGQFEIVVSPVLNTEKSKEVLEVLKERFGKVPVKIDLGKQIDLPEIEFPPIKVDVPSEAPVKDLTDQAARLGRVLAGLAKFGITPVINLQGIVDNKGLLEKFEAQLKNLEKTADERFTAIKNVASGIGDAFSSAFDAIASGKNAFQAVGTALKQLVLDLIKTAIKGLVVRAILSGMVPGVGVTGLGGILSGIQGGVPGFAKGGIISGSTIGLIGEGIGTNRQNPEVVAPLDNLKSFFGDMLNVRAFGNGSGVGIGGGGQLQALAPVELYFDGDTMRGTLLLAEQKQGRNR